ncbi:MAG: AMP-binding protein, partial [Gammaproteobacteria bacterium]|nr:AMP-binding protein [Gammaproteobacteria bacterium]
AERLNPEVRDAFEQKFNRNIYEGYGTTETTPVAGVNIPDRLNVANWSIQQGTKQGSIGMALPGSSFRIVDPEILAQLPAGEDGLILIGGTQIMQGYLKDQAKTDSVIINQDGLRWYNTGDKGHLDEDGFLSIVDRYSRFAKIGGEMVSLGAVESAINAVVPETVEVLSTAIPDEKKGEQVVLLFSGPVTESELKALILKKSGLKQLMLPSHFVPVK